jgi:segregation and condensation protein B
MKDLKNILESLLFVSESPLTVERMKKAVPEADPADIRASVQALIDEYEAKGGGFVLKEIAGGFQFRTRPEYHGWIKNMIQPNPVRLSQAMLETLAIIAYKQPIIRSDIEHIRGVDCGGIIRTLLERKLVRILGRKEIPGRPLIYATTKYFLELFDLRNLKDLPSPKEIEALQGPPTGQGENGEATAENQIGSENVPEEEVPGPHETETAESEEGGRFNSENTTDQDDSPEDETESERSENGEPSDSVGDAVRDVPPEDETKSEGFENEKQLDAEDAVAQDAPPEDETKSGRFENAGQLAAEDAAETGISPGIRRMPEKPKKASKTRGELDQSNAVPPLAELPSDSAEHGVFDVPDQDNPDDATALSPAPADEKQTVPETQEQPPISETKEPDAESSEPSSDSSSSLADYPPEAPETDATPEKE